MGQLRPPGNTESRAMERSTNPRRAARGLMWIVTALLSLSFYPPQPGASPPFYGDVGVMTTSMDIDTLSNVIGGKKTFIFYFLPTCPHCRDAAPTIARLAGKYGDRLQFLGVSPGRGPLSALRAFVEEFDLPFQVVQDSGSIFGRRNGLKGTPAYLLTDGSASPPVTYMSFTPDMADVLEIAIRKFIGEDPMAVLDPGRYHGSQVCATCHREAYLSWSLTPHAASFYALVRNDAFEKVECLGCHVTGRGEPGGYQDVGTTPWAAEVGCEVCHGMAGGHGPKDRVGQASGSHGRASDERLEARYATVCARCHDETRPLPVIGGALKSVRHTTDRDVTPAVWKVRRRALFEGEAPRPAAIASSGNVGAGACRPCHEEAFEGWMASPHARALARLKPEARASGSNCLGCHQTARSGTRDEAASAGVQCESCHGPGRAHVEAKGGKDNIVVLRGRSASCVVQPRCAACHDEKNDPDFDFEAALKRVRADHHVTR